MEKAPKAPLTVSFIVPAYNDAEFLERSAGSCLAQTYGQIQVVIVDDGSTDGTRTVAERLAASDPRVKVVALDENSGTHEARRAGIAQATGQLVMFVDGDDEVAPETAETAVQEYAEVPFDVLHFATRVESDGGKVSKERVRRLEEWMRPVKGTLIGRDILARSFVDHAYSFSVACKAFPLSLVKRAFDDIADIWADSGEDALEYFAIAYHAQTYRGLPDKRYYVYHMGDGLSERQGMTAAQFQRVLRLHDSVEGVCAFLMRVNGMSACGDIFQAHWDDQLRVSASAWLDDVMPADQPACLEQLMEEWPRESVVDVLCKEGSRGVDAMRAAVDANDELREKLGGKLELTEQQIWQWGYADGRAEVRGEYEQSVSYRLGRLLSAPARKLLKR